VTSFEPALVEETVVSGRRASLGSRTRRAVELAHRPKDDNWDERVVRRLPPDEFGHAVANVESEAQIMR